MSNINIQSNSSANTLSAASPTRQKPVENKTLKPLNKGTTLAQDTVSIKDSKYAVLKGAGMGALSAGLGTSIFVKIPSKSVLSSSLIAAVGGALGGAVAANVTDDKATAALIGAGVGAASMVLGVAMFSTSATDTSALATLTRAAIGAASGAVGGIAGSTVHQPE